MKIFIGGAFFNTSKKDVNIYSYIAKILKEILPNVTIIEPNTIEFFRKNYEQTHPDISKKDIDKAMVDYDLEQVKSCSLFIADITNKSTGLGLELGILKEHNKKVVFIARSNSEISKMVLGAFYDTEIYYYSSLNDVNNIINEIVEKYIKE